MEKIIILLLIVVILLLLSDKMPITHSKKRAPQPKATPIPKTAPSTSVMGESRFVPPAKVVTTAIPLTEKEQQDILTEWEEEPTIDLEDEEEDLRSYRTEEEDNDFATGLSFEDLEKVATFLSEDKEEVTTENIELLQKVKGTSLLEAIEKAFMESYRQVCHNNVEITNEFLRTVEEELKDNSLSKELKKVSNQLDKVLKKEKDLVELRLNEAISMDLYQEKYNEITLSKEKLLGEKRTLEVTLTDEKALKKRLEGFKKLLESNKYLEEFDRAVFESIVDKIIIGGTNDEGEIDPAMITIIYKTGKKDSQDGRLFKSRRKNAKEVNEETDNKLYPHSSDEVNNLCSYHMANTVRSQKRTQ